MKRSKIFLGISASVLAVAAFAASKAKFTTNLFYTNATISGCEQKNLPYTQTVSTTPGRIQVQHVFTKSNCTGSLPYVLPVD